MVKQDQRRILCMWFPRLASDRVLRAHPVEGPFVLTFKQANAEKIYCLNEAAQVANLYRGMSFADARALYPDLRSQPARPDLDSIFLSAIRRWAIRYCPWAGREGRDGLVLDITGSSHLWGGEEALLADISARLAKAGVTVRLGRGATRGAAWAQAHYGPQDDLARLPIAALRIKPDVTSALQRLGLRSIGDLQATARAPLARRFGPELMLRLDQATGMAPETVDPENDPPHFATRMTLPEPIGLVADVMAAINQLLRPLCAKLQAHHAGARRLLLTLRRVDQASEHVELRLAAAMRDPARILPMFQRRVETVEAGFGIDMVRLEATQVEPMPIQQIGNRDHHRNRLSDLITQIGLRIGLENIRRFKPVNSYIPENRFLLTPAHEMTDPIPIIRSRHPTKPRPLIIYPPELINIKGATLPQKFHWRRIPLKIEKATGPERIAPEWWVSDNNWKSGLRDYWKIDTREGRRFWLFHTPQDPNWFAQGEFA